MAGLQETARKADGRRKPHTDSPTDTDTPDSRSLATSLAWYSMFNCMHCTQRATRTLICIANFAMTCNDTSSCRHISPEFHLHPAHPPPPTVLHNLSVNMVCRSESHYTCCAAPPAPATHGHVLQDAATCHARACSALGAVRRWPSLAACPCSAALSAPLTPQSARSTSPCLDQASLAFARRVAQSCSCMQGPISVRGLMHNAAPHRPTIPHRPSIHTPLAAQASIHPLARTPGVGRHSSLHMLYRRCEQAALHRCYPRLYRCRAAYTARQRSRVLRMAVRKTVCGPGPPWGLLYQL